MESESRATLERECDVTFFKASGPGGQHRNKRETGVRLLHRPSGVVVTAVERRSQAQNLENAYERLAQRLAELNRSRKRRVATKKSAGAQKRRLQEKRRQSEKKTQRHGERDEPES